MNKVVIEYFLKQAKSIVTAEEIIKLDTWLFWGKIALIVGLGFAFLTGCGIYMNCHDYNYSDLIVTLVKNVTPILLILAMILIGGPAMWLLVIETDYKNSNVMRRRKDLIKAETRFVKFFGRKPLTSKEISWVNFPVERVIVKQMAKALLARRIEGESANLRARAVVNDMYDSAKEFCRVADYGSLFNRAAEMDAENPQR